MSLFVCFVSVGPTGCGGLDIVDARLIREMSSRDPDLLPSSLDYDNRIHFVLCRLEAKTWDEARDLLIGSLRNPEWCIPDWYRGKLLHFLSTPHPTQ